MLAALLLCGLLGSALAADILAVFPHNGKSHFDVFEPLMLALAARGHRVTVLGFYPQKTAVANYTDISLVGVIPLRLNRVQIGEEDTLQPDTFSVTNMGLTLCEKILIYPPVKRVLDSDARFDLVILELFDSDCFLSLVHKYRAPYIGFNSAKTTPQQDGLVGTPYHPGYVSHINLGMDTRMSFLQRAFNLAYTLYMSMERFVLLLWDQWKFRRMVGAGFPSLETIAHSASLILVNTHHSLLGARPLVPAHVEVGGIHIKPVKPINQELDQFLNESPEGAILFSMGSVLQSSSFPADKRQAIMEAFAELPVRVLMKWENDSLPGKPDNVRLSKWLPQRDILAHPKIVAFMGHGGLLSTSEAVHCGVPMVLIPMFGDQPNNVAHLVARGAAVKLDYGDITKETALRALRAVLYDSRYREKAQTLSAQFRDRPMSPLDTAVYWTEYVIRHKGAPNLRSPAVDMPWYQLWLLDVVAVLLVALASLLLAVFWLAKRTTMLVSRLLYSEQTKKKKN